jgi:hypothetical protein
MRTLVYKRTHHGDPDADGRFGVHGCMGRVRTWAFEAVIGIGGKRPWPEWKRLAGKVNWIGIGPRRTGATDKRGFPVVTFDHFLLFGADGTEGWTFAELAPRLAERMYTTNVRVLMDDLDEAERAEIDRVLALAKDAPPSSAVDAATVELRHECRQRQSKAPVKGCSR